MRTLLRTWSIRTILIVLFVSMMVLNVGLTSYLAFRTGQTAVTDLAHQLQRETTARIEDHLQDYLALPHHINQINLDAIALGQIDLADFATLEPHFWRQVQHFNIGGVAYATARGDYLNLGREDPHGPILVAVTDATIAPVMRVYATDDQGHRTRVTQIYAAYDPRPRPWYQQAVAAGQAQWTPIFLWTNGAIGIDAVVPVYGPDRHLRGVLDVSLTLEDISRFLQQLAVGKTGMTYIIDRDGLIVASSADEPPYIKAHERSTRQSALASQAPLIQGSAQALLHEVGGFAAIQTQETFAFDLETGRHLGQVTPYRDSQGLDWLIIVVVPETDFMGQIIANTQATSLLVLVSLVITIGIASGAAARITQPILALNHAAKAFAAGDWDRAVPQGGVREVSELADAFGSMAAQLRATFATVQLKEHRLREALEAARMGTWDWNVPQQRVMWSEQVAPLYGLAPGEQSGPPEMFLRWIHPEDRLALAEQVNACIAQQQTTFAIEHRTIWPDGSVHWLEGTGRIWRDAHDRPQHLRGTITEVTARKQADAALRESQERYRIISELVSSYAYAYCCDPDGTLTLEWVTDAFTRITGYDRPQLGVIAAWDAVISAADRARVQHHRAQLLAGETPEMIEYAIVTCDGRPLWLREYQQPIWDVTAGRVVQLYGAAQDITRFKHLEQQLQQAQKMEAIGRLAGGIAHDFNNLLTVILGNCALILDSTDRDTPTWGDVAAIQDAAARAAMLTRQLLTFSRQQVLQPQVLRVNVVVTAMGQLLQRLIGENITLMLRLDPALGSIQADPSQVEQVVMNLAINARDAMPTGGTLIIETAEIRRDGRRWALLGVHDTGIGMDAVTQAHLFEPFFTTKGLGAGTGLGLATVHGIVLQSGGQIEVTSVIGHGTSFRIILPLIEPPINDAPAAALPALSRGAGTILLVEDEDSVRALASRVLRAHGYDVLEAGSGTQALQIADQHPHGITLLLTDMIMPGGLTGHELAEHLVTRTPALKVLYISGYTEAMPTTIVNDPNRRWLQKPFTPDALVRLVGDILQRR